jgi:two-component system KDP operon response regulator KdpE
LPDLLLSEPLILAVDDDGGVLRLLTVELQAQGFRVITTDSPARALALAASEEPDLALIDVVMPAMSGIDLMKRIQAHRRIPIILVTGRDRAADRVHGLEAGADDYVVKPFGPEELGARIRAVLRRGAHTPRELPPISAGGLDVYLGRRLVTRDGRPVTLTRSEWLLLQYLVRNSGRVLLYEDILENVWGPDYRTDSQYLRVWISRLRAKLESNPNRPDVIRTHLGMGYVFVADVHPRNAIRLPVDNDGELLRRARKVRARTPA